MTDTTGHRQLAIRTDPPPLTLSAVKAAAYIGVGPTTFYKLKAMGKVRPVLLGGTKVYRRKDLDRYVDSLKPAR